MSLSAIFILLCGAALGSFLNVVIFRNKNVRQISRTPPPAGNEEAGALRGRSHCPFCHRTLAWPELIPILSFIFLRGRCRTCRHQLSPQYPLVELGMAIFTLILFTPLPATPDSITAAILGVISIALLLILSIIDLRTLLLPDTFTIILTVTVVLTLLNNYSLQPTAYNLRNVILGAMLGSGVLAFLWLITRGRGIGLGDVKLMIPLGALFGPLPTIVLLFLAFVIGGGVGTFLLLTGRANMKTAVPFGPFLAGVAILFILIPTIPQTILSFIFHF